MRAELFLTIIYAVTVLLAIAVVGFDLFVWRP